MRGHNGQLSHSACLSSSGQTANLVRQVAKLLELYPCFELITDIASGLNFKPAGLKAVLEGVR